MDCSIQQMETSMSETKDFVYEIFKKDLSTMEHSIDVYNLVNEFYFEFPRSFKTALNKENLLNAALLHDVGKLLIPDSILKKPCGLSSVEKDIIKNHAANGKMILKNTKFKKIADMVCYHHERADGKGYFSLSKDQTPLESKIIAVADAYSALTSNRVYRKRCEVDKAVSILKDISGTQLDKRLVELFIPIAEKQKPF